MLLITIVSYYLFRREIITPVMAFLIPFCLAIVNLIFNIKTWNVDLGTDVILVLTLGSTSLVLGALLAMRIYQMRRRNKKNYPVANNMQLIDIPVSLLIAFAIFQILSVFLCLKAISHVATTNGYSGSIIYEIGWYKRLSTFTTVNVSLGRLQNLLYDVCTTSGYVWGYLIAHNYVAKKKIQIWLVINLLLSILMDFIKGGRQSAIQLIFAVLVMVIILYMNNTGKTFRPSLKQLLIGAVVAVVFLGTFQWVGNHLLGRVSNTNISHYVAIYLSGPIRNLDEFLKSDHQYPEIFGKMTFARLINWFGGKLHNSNLTYVLDLPYCKANGNAAGNVYTTFYSFAYDFGIKGVIVLPFLMGLISESLYYVSKRLKSSANISIGVIVYSYVFYLMAFSFFSNKFYEGLFTVEFLKRMIIWAIAAAVINNLYKVRIKRVKLRFK